MLHEMMEAPTRADARLVRERFRSEFDAKYPKAVARLDQGLDAADGVLRVPRRALAPPADHQPDREQLRDRQAAPARDEGSEAKKAALAMAYKLLDTAQQRWRRFNGHELVTYVLAGATYKDGIRITDDINDEEMTDEKVAA